jgi:hypothetical protein
MVESFFKEPHQIIHLGVVEGFIWFTSFNMFNKKRNKDVSYSLSNGFIFQIDALHRIRWCKLMG